MIYGNGNLAKVELGGVSRAGGDVSVATMQLIEQLEVDNPTTGFYLLTEDGEEILLEDGTNLLLEDYEYAAMPEASGESVSAVPMTISVNAPTENAEYPATVTPGTLAVQTPVTTGDESVSVIPITGSVKTPSFSQGGISVDTLLLVGSVKEPSSVGEYTIWKDREKVNTVYTKRAKPSSIWTKEDKVNTNWN